MEKTRQIILRHFEDCDRDCDFITNSLWRGTTADSAKNMIARWQTLRHNNDYFEMLAVEADECLAGYVSLYEIQGSISLGAELILKFRGQGIGYAATTKLMQISRELGYKKAVARVLADNSPSLALCKKLGFIILGEGKTKDGKLAYNLERIL